jgi:uncharacterized membrane protein YidH (DUF202 family)
VIVDRRPAGSDAGGCPEEMEDLDPGLARERTVLAWSRTGLSFLALGGILVRVDPLGGLTVLGLGGLVWLLGYFHHRSLWTAGGAVRWLTRPRAVRLIALGTALVSLVALAIAILGQGPPLV